MRAAFSVIGSRVPQTLSSSRVNTTTCTVVNNFSSRENSTQNSHQNRFEGILNGKMCTRSYGVCNYSKSFVDSCDVDASITEVSKRKMKFHEGFNGRNCEGDSDDCLNSHPKGIEKNVSTDNALASKYLSPKIVNLRSKAMVSNVFMSHSKFVQCILCEVLLAALAHPFYSLAVHIVTDESDFTTVYGNNCGRDTTPSVSPVLSYSQRALGLTLLLPVDFAATITAVVSTSGWVSSYCMGCRSHGYLSFLGGLRVSIVARLCNIIIPYSPGFLMGIYESFLHQRILNPTSIREFNSSSIKRKTSQIFWPMVHEGVYGIFRYGILTVMQIVPGFLALVAFRCTLWIFFGSTLKRKRQKIARCKVCLLLHTLLYALLIVVILTDFASFLGCKFSFPRGLRRVKD